MGWSCTAAASRRLDSWRGVCVASTGSQNMWETDRGRLFFELGPERADGGVGGEVWAFDDVGGIPVGFFVIEHDGSVSEWPYGLRELVNSQGWERSRRSGAPSSFGGGRS